MIGEGCLITELVNAADCPDVSLALARVPPGVKTRLHALDGVAERYVVRAGRGRAEIGGETAEVSPGDIVAIAPGVSQRITALGGDWLEFYCLCQPRFTPQCYRDLEFE
jgi:mannose-6-phosphate isomerase-like protein (cupin superfamily)